MYSLQSVYVKLIIKKSNSQKDVLRFKVYPLTNYSVLIGFKSRVKHFGYSTLYTVQAFSSCTSRPDVCQ